MTRKLSLLTGAALALLSCTTAAQTPRDPLSASIEPGEVVGQRSGETVAFLGIPFAAPPVGDLRWRAPQPVTPFTEPFDATSYANDCMQIPFDGDAAPLGTPPAEDCLYVNVWKPADAEPGADLPVLVWIYGGGWVNGGSSPAVYDGAPTAAEGVVFVSFNYRLGRFGFFAHPALTAANEDDGLLGNYGYLDQIAALEWVRDNVAAFGGDPDRVTIMGESAGGGSVANLLTTPMAEGLFHGAVAMSAPVRADAGLKPVRSADGTDGEADGAAFARWAGVEGEGAEALAALRALPAETVVAGTGMFNTPVAPASGPMIDGTILPGASRILAEGGQAKVPTMAGAVSEDIGWGAPMSLDAFFAEYPDPEAARAAYADVGDDAEAVLFQARQDALMQEPARFIVESQAEAGVPAFHYRYGYVAETMRDEWTGTQHATEIPFFLDTVEARYGDELTAADRDAASLINAYLVNFVRTGNPNGEGLPEWPPFDPDAPNVMAITFDEASAGADPWQARLDAAKSKAEAAAGGQ